MSNVALAKPGSLTSAVISNAKLSTTGTDFYIKVLRWQFPWQMEVWNTTGDGDNAMSWDANYWFDSEINLDGLMVASAANGLLIANIVDSTKNPITSTVKFGWSSNQFLNYPKALIYAGSAGWRRTAPAIREIFRIKCTDSIPTWSSS